MASVMASPAPALALLLLAASIAASQAGVNCGDSPASPSPAAPPTSKATNSSVFRANLLTLLNALPQAAAPTGFASLSRGGGSDQVFVRGLCRGDSTQSECLANLQVAVRDFGGKCASSRSAAAWYDKCCITYADTNASVGYEELLSEVFYDTNKASDPDSYGRTYYALMKSLVARAASGGGNTSARMAMFATGEAVYAPSDPKGTMYGLVQCMRDISAAECMRSVPAVSGAKAADVLLGIPGRGGAELQLPPADSSIHLLRPGARCAATGRYRSTGAGRPAVVRPRNTR